MADALHGLRSAFGRKTWLGLSLLCLISLPAGAQLVTLDPDWKESDAPAPPAFQTGRLLPLDMPPYVSVKLGIDPDTLSISPEGIVRYVVVAQNPSGSATAFYEGIRCVTGEVKSYARTNAQGRWVAVRDPQWRDLTDRLPSKHAWVFARQAACDGRAAAASTVGDIVRALRR